MRTPLVACLLVGTLLTVPAPEIVAQDYMQDPNFGALRLKESFLPDPQSVSVTSGGSIEVDVGECDYGYVSDAPDVDLYYTTSGGADLYVYAEGEGDTMLLINGPGGDWYCNDDGHGNLDPVLHFSSAEDGLYSIWIGSYSQDYHQATLYVSELSPGSSDETAGRPDVSLEPTYGDVELDEGFVPDPHTISLTAGGGVDVEVGSCTYGYVADAPDVDVYYTTTGGADLYVYAESDQDVMLLINGPDGTWVCDDDGWEGTNPVVVIPNAAAGLYDVWVGTYGSDTAAATLHISEIDPR